MDDLKETNPQQMLEDAFRAIYELDSSVEAQRVDDENALMGYQIKWCDTFKQTFSFVSEYGAKLVLHMNSDLEVKQHHIDKCCIQLVSDWYSIEVHPPKPGEDICRCLEHYAFEFPYTRKEVFLTLPEITQHVSKGLAKSNDDKKQLK